MIKPQCDLEIQSISGTNFSVPQWQIDIAVPPYDNLSLENSANHRHRPNRVAFNVVHIGLKLHGKTSKNMDVYIGKQCKKKTIGALTGEKKNWAALHGTGFSARQIHTNP